MDSFQDSTGQNRTALNLVMRESCPLNSNSGQQLMMYQGNFETLSRPRETTSAESEQSAAEEPLSGVGAS
jgi:hypothetical protein